MGGIGILTASSNEDHMRDDIDIFSFELSDDELASLDALQLGPRGCADCYTDQCRSCRAVLDSVGCPEGFTTGNPNGAECVKCADKNKQAILGDCGGEAMAAKACGA